MITKTIKKQNLQATKRKQEGQNICDTAAACHLVIKGAAHNDRQRTRKWRL
jgi:hypothetical protein